MDKEKKSSNFLNFLTGQVLIASPQMMDARFIQSVILICSHDQHGAMGLILNRLINNISLSDLLEKIGISMNDKSLNIPVHSGGPIEMGRGFLLHSPDYIHEASVKISDQFFLTSTLEILQAIAQGKGPEKKILALGYAGWSSEQLENELQKNYWLQTSADQDLIFSDNLENVWKKSLTALGIVPEFYSSYIGHA